MNNWKKVKLSDIIEFNPRETLSKGAIAKKIAMEKLEPFTRDIPEFEYLEFRGGTKFRNGDTLMARITPSLENGKTSKVNLLDEDEVGFGSTEFIVVRAKEKISDENFVYYLMIAPNIREVAIKSMVGTSGRQRVQLDVVKNHEILCPPLKEQIRIGKILKALDDKIENNKKINHHLEQMAQAIFKSWFVDFEPFGGEMPSKWQTKPADCFFDISIGKTPPRKENWCFSEDSKDVPWISISDMGKEGLFINKTSEYLTREAIDKFNVKVVPQNTILLSFKLTIGRIAITNCKMSTNEAIAHFKLTNKHALEWLYCFLNNINYAELGNTSSIATAINSKIIKSMLITMPDSSSLSKFHKIAAPIFEEIRNNHEEIESLQNLRESLLPKLLSGEISVNQATK